MTEERDTPTQPKVYQPSLGTREKMGEFLHAFTTNPECWGNIALSMKHIGVPRQHFADRWMKNPEFAEEYETARAELAGGVRAALIKKALGKDANTHALIHLDKLLNKEDYRDEGSKRPDTRIIINMPGLAPGPGHPPAALPPVADEHLLEAQGWIVHETQYLPAPGAVVDDEGWYLDGETLAPAPGHDPSRRDGDGE